MRRHDEQRRKKFDADYAAAREATEKAGEVLVKKSQEQVGKCKLLKDKFAAVAIEARKHRQRGQHAASVKLDAESTEIAHKMNTCNANEARMKKQIRLDNQRHQADIKAAEREHRRRVSEARRKQEHIVKEEAKKSKDDSDDEQRGKRQGNEELNKVHRQAREETSKVRDWGAEQVSKGRVEVARYNRLEQDIKLHQDRVLKQTNEQKAKIHENAKEEKKKLKDSAEQEKKATKSAQKSLESMETKIRSATAEDRGKLAEQKAANIQARAAAKAAQEKNLEEVKQAQRAADKANQASQIARVAEEEVKGKITVAQKAEQVSKIHEKTAAQRAEAAHKADKREEQRGKAELRKEVVKAPEAPHAQNPQEQKLAVARTVAEKLPPLPSAWFCLDGLKFIVKA